MSLIISERTRSLGKGLSVGRILPYAKRRMVGPFIFLDHMGPTHLAPHPAPSVDVLPHPHIGLSTLTYLFSGEIVHRDSLGTKVTIEPGAVNWMTAGRGITHSERFEKARRLGDHLHGLQAWVALPAEHEEVAPQFNHHPASSLPSWQEQGVSYRLLAGEAYGLVAPVTVFSPLHYAHLELAPGATAELPSNHTERSLFVVRGAVTVQQQVVTEGQLLVLDAAASRLTAVTSSTVMLLGGEPMGHRYIYWNFISSRKKRLEEAAQAWVSGSMALPDDDDQEAALLPEGPGPEAPGFS